MTVDHMISLIFAAGILVGAGIVRIKYIPRMFGESARSALLYLWVEIVLTIIMVGTSATIIWGATTAINALVLSIGAGFPITVALDRISDIMEGWKIQNMADEAETKLKEWV